MLEWLEQTLQVDTTHQLGQAFDNYMSLRRRDAREEAQDYATRHRNAITRLRELGVGLSDVLKGYMFLRRLSASEKMGSTILSLSAGQYDFTAVTRAAQTPSPITHVRRRRT